MANLPMPAMQPAPNALASMPQNAPPDPAQGQQMNALMAGPQQPPMPQHGSAGMPPETSEHVANGQMVANAAAGMSPQQMAKTIADLDYASTEFATLVSNPDVKPKDVVKAAAKAVADGHATPSAAIKVLSDIPDNPDQLKSWLKQKYKTNLATAVHFKNIMMVQAAKAPNTMGVAQ